MFVFIIIAAVYA